MRRLLVTLAAITCFIGAAVLVGGKAGLVGGTLAVLLLAAAAVSGVSGLVTAAGGALAGTYIAALVLQQAPPDLEAPLIGTLLVVAMEIGHLSLGGDRYALPGGTAALAVRSMFTAGMCVAGLAVAWLIVLSSYLLPRPGETISLVVGALTTLAVLGLLVMQRRLAGVQ